MSELVEAFAALDPPSSRRFRVLGRRGWTSPASAAVEVVELPVASEWAGSMTAAAVLLDRSSDCHHYFFAPHAVGVAVARGVSRTTRAKIIQTVTSRPRSFRPGSALLFGETVVVPSRWSRRRWIDAGVDPQRVRVIPPPLAPLTEPTEVRRDQARRELRIGAADRVILFPGDAGLDRGLEPLIDALPAILRAIPRALLLLAVRGKSDLGRSALDRVTRRCRERHLMERVRFAGVLKDLPAVFSLADLCVLPAATTYGKVDYPYAVLEAMDLGVPLLVAEGTAMVELAEGDCAAVVPLRPVNELAEAVVGLLTNDERRLELGRRGRRTVRALCDPEVIAKRHLRLYGSTQE